MSEQDNRQRLSDEEWREILLRKYEEDWERMIIKPKELGFIYRLKNKDKINKKRKMKRKNKKEDGSV